MLLRGNKIKIFDTALIKLYHVNQCGKGLGILPNIRKSDELKLKMAGADMLMLRQEAAGQLSYNKH